MKKILVTIIAFMFSANVNVYAKEIQLTDYVFTNGKRMLDGYSYVSYGSKYHYKTRGYQETESNIVTPNGQLLFAPNYFTVDYSVETEPPNDDPEDKFTYNLPLYSYPQGISGKDFIVQENDRQYLQRTDYRGAYTAIIDFEGNLKTKPEYVTYNSITDDYYVFSRSQIPLSFENGILNIKTGNEFALGGYMYYYSPETDEFAVIYNNDGVISNNGRCILVIYKNEKEIERIDTKKSAPQVIIGNNKDEIYFNDDELSLYGKQFKGLRTDNQKTPNAYDPYIFMDFNIAESSSDRVDKNYVFKKKNINGVDYYALFKNIVDGESENDYKPTEQSSIKYTEYINHMISEKLLYNNECCFYKQGISKLDFSIVLGRTYCKASNYIIDDFKTNTKFEDVNNPYSLLLSDIGILNSETNFYANENELTKKVVSNALDKMAEKCGVLSEWNSIKVIQPTDAVCSRELAYVETFRLYELIKKHNNPNYVAFTPSQALDSDSEAETMHYETVSYNASNAETSTEMTTQATAVSGENTSKITVASIIGSIIAVFAGISAAAKG